MHEKVGQLGTCTSEGQLHRHARALRPVERAPKRDAVGATWSWHTKSPSNFEMAPTKDTVKVASDFEKIIQDGKSICVKGFDDEF